MLLCLSLAATSQMHAHDVCVLSLLRLWDCGPIDAIVEIKNETVWRSLKWNLGSRCARLAFFRLQSVGPFGLTAWDLFIVVRYELPTFTTHRGLGKRGS